MMEELYLQAKDDYDVKRLSLIRKKDVYAGVIRNFLNKHFSLDTIEIVKVKLDEHSTEIKLKRADDDRYTNDITIYNERKWNEPAWVFKPKISWSATMAMTDNTDMLDYLKFLGWLATEMQNYENSEFFKVLAEYVCKYTAEEEDKQVAATKMNELKTSINQNADNKAKAEFYDNLQEGQWYLKKKYKAFQNADGSRPDVLDKIAVAKVIKCSTKTVTFQYMECNDLYDVARMDHKNWRKNYKDTYALFHNYELVDYATIKKEAIRTQIVDSIREAISCYDHTEESNIRNVVENQLVVDVFNSMNNVLEGEAETIYKTELLTFGF